MSFGRAKMCASASPGCMRLNVRSLGDIWFGEVDRGLGTLELADGTGGGGGGLEFGR
jgi:hypothetical protein